MSKEYVRTDAEGGRHYFKVSSPEMNIRHRLDGPAVEYADGGKTWWYVNGVLIFQTNKEGNILYRMR